jgi:type I restriction enzyme S subunit
MSETRWDIPENWVWAVAGDFARIVGGGTPSSKVEGNFSEQGIPWITPADLTGYRDSHISRGRRDLSKTGFAGCGAQMSPAGSVLFSSRAPIGYCVVASNDVSTNQGFKSLVLEGGIVPEYVRHYLVSAKDYAESKASGTTFMELSGARVAELSVPIAPLPEQKRIVAKVDGLTVRTARARTDLARIPTLIARYKKRLLALAFSGELTAGWRKANGLSAAKLTDLASLCITLTDGDHQAPPKASTGVPFITISAMNTGKIDLTRATRAVPESYFDSLKESRRPAVGDVLFSVTGSVGIPALVETNSKFVFQRHIAILKPDTNHISGKYLFHILSAPQIKEQVVAAATGTAQLTVPLRGLRKFLVSHPTSEEQNEIVRLIDSAFKWLDRIAADHGAASNLLPKLDAAILGKAFRGELVPQDPNDEPASMLLERIRKERAAAPKKPRGQRSVAASEVIEIQLPTVQVNVSVGPVTIRETRGGQAMTKSRHDDDVMEQPYLAGLIKKGSAGTAKDLFKASDLPIADFYKQLAWEIEHKHIRDDDEKLEAF